MNQENYIKARAQALAFFIGHRWLDVMGAARVVLVVVEAAEHVDCYYD